MYSILTEVQFWLNISSPQYLCSDFSVLITFSLTSTHQLTWSSVRQPCIRPAQDVATLSLAWNKSGIPVGGWGQLMGGWGQHNPSHNRALGKVWRREGDSMRPRMNAVSLSLLVMILLYIYVFTQIKNTTKN